MDDEASAKIFQQPRKHQKQAASGARKHWMKKGEEKQGGWGGGRGSGGERGVEATVGETERYTRR